MAVNSNSANSNADIEKFSEGLESILDTIAQTPGSVQEVLNLGKTLLGDEKVQIRPLLTEMVNNIDRPLLKRMAHDVVGVMSNWFEDPQTLCCIIQGIHAFHNRIRVTLKDIEFTEWLDVLIAFIDVILVLLSSNIKKISIAIPDFIKEIMTGVVGAILLVLQETLFTLRDSLINWLLEGFDTDAKTDQIWAKCLPLVELIEIIRKYISDYGLFAELFEKIKGYIGNIVGELGYLKAFDFPKNIKDLEFLYWFRELLVKLKFATLSFELCFLPASSVPELVQGPLGTTTNAKGSSVLPSDTNTNREVVGNQVQGITVASDGTILEDKAKLKANSLTILTNSSVRGFLHKYYGYPLEVVDALIVGPTSKDSVIGTDVGGNLDLNADCPNSPSPADAIRWALRVNNRNI